jgi:hypothetical protein
LENDELTNLSDGIFQVTGLNNGFTLETPLKQVSQYFITYASFPNASPDDPSPSGRITASTAFHGSSWTS